MTDTNRKISEKMEENIQKNRQTLVDLGYEDAIVFDGPEFDRAIIGTTTDGRVVYSFDKMVECLAEDESIGYEDAAEFIEYNTVRSLNYVERAPVIVTDMDMFK